MIEVPPCDPLLPYEMREESPFIDWFTNLAKVKNELQKGY